MITPPTPFGRALEAYVNGCRIALAIIVALVLVATLVAGVVNGFAWLGWSS
jgi:hypothetical protein